MTEYVLGEPEVEPKPRLLAWLQEYESSTAVTLRYLPEGYEPADSGSYKQSYKRAPWLDEPEAEPDDWEGAARGLKSLARRRKQERDEALERARKAEKDLDQLDCVRLGALERARKAEGELAVAKMDLADARIRWTTVPPGSATTPVAADFVHGPDTKHPLRGRRGSHD